MARGLALLLGFDLPINFDRPYAATSIQDFWGRWHMSLSRWLRDFLFRPLVLGGQRGRVATARNLLLVMFLAGLWHGAAWTFVVWGGIHGVGLVWDRLSRQRRRRLGRPRPDSSGWRVAGRRFVTFHVVALAWVVFRADSLTRAGEVLAQLGRWGPAYAVTPLLLAVIVAVVGAQYLPRGFELRVRLAFARVGPALQAACLGGALLVIDALGPAGVAPFIYFRF
jgi:D-alanyl-lipoteichoic acid acyltransferase DltB (MBOAT superfamily)